MPIYIIYTVKSGDTLGDIALRFDTTVDDIATLNNIADTNRLAVGQQLRIPAPIRPAPPRPPKPPKPMPRVHVVQPGDTLYAIAQMHGTTVDTLVRLNGIRNPARIYPGQEIRLPK